MKVAVLMYTTLIGYEVAKAMALYLLPGAHIIYRSSIVFQWIRVVLDR